VVSHLQHTPVDSGHAPGRSEDDAVQHTLPSAKHAAAEPTEQHTPDGDTHSPGSSRHVTFEATARDARAASACVRTKKQENARTQNEPQTRLRRRQQDRMNSTSVRRC
jgi:hypothetical protein